MTPGWVETEVNKPPDFAQHLLTNIGIEEVFPCINNQMLYGKHLGVKQVKKRLNDPDDLKIISLQEKVRYILEWVHREGIFSPKGIYQWLSVSAENENIIFV